MIENQQDHRKKQFLGNSLRKLQELSNNIKPYARSEASIFKQDYSDISNALKIDKSIKKIAKTTWKTAPLRLRKKSHHIARLRAIPILLIFLFLIRIFISTPSEVIFTIFSFSSLLIIGAMYYSYKLTRTRSIHFSKEVTEWIWKRIPSDHEAELFENAYGTRNAGDIIAPWIQTRSRIKDWYKEKFKLIKTS